MSVLTRTRYGRSMAAWILVIFHPVSILRLIGERCCKRSDARYVLHVGVRHHMLGRHTSHWLGQLSVCLILL